jgi:xylulose-5-phosphate/fructose-6-phosphate phosphoketolase
MSTVEMATHENGTRALADAELRRLDALWRAANYLSVGQITLDNPRAPLERAQHQAPAGWGTTPV